jgi:hypothetical protein
VSAQRSQKRGGIWVWLRNRIGLVIACISAVIIGYAVGVIFANVNDSNSAAPPPARNPILDAASPSSSATVFHWLVVLVPILLVVLVVLLRNRRPVRWALRRLHIVGVPTAATLPADYDANGLNDDHDSADADPDDDYDGCIISVLTFRVDPVPGGEPKRTMTVARGIAASTREIEEGFCHTRAPRDEPAGSGVNRFVDVISFFGVDRARVAKAHLAAAELGQRIENEFGLHLLVSNSPSASAHLLPDQGANLADQYSSVFFSESSTNVDLHGLMPIAVYARVPLAADDECAPPAPPIPSQVAEQPPLAAPRDHAQPPHDEASDAGERANDAIRAIRAMGSIRTIRTMDEMLDELLSKGQPLREAPAQDYAPSH